jgi:hypothetical protein
MNRAIRIIKPKFLAWFLVAKPSSASMELWDRWRDNFIHRYPVRYFLQETLPSFYRRKLYQLKEIGYYVKFRTIEKYHVLNLKETLSPGWHDEEKIMLHANFNILTKFIENLGWKNISDWKKENKGKKFTKSIRKQQGLVMAQWYIEQSHNVEEYKKIIRLYNWWTTERPQRLDLYKDDRFWDRSEETGNKKRRKFSMVSTKSQKFKYELLNNTEEFYEKQDQSMLEILVSIRRTLWS